MRGKARGPPFLDPATALCPVSFTLRQGVLGKNTGKVSDYESVRFQPFYPPQPRLTIRASPAVTFQWSGYTPQRCAPRRLTGGTLMDSGTLIIAAIVWLGFAIWTYFDATGRGLQPTDAAAWAFGVFLLLILVLPVYLLSRPRKGGTLCAACGRYYAGAGHPRHCPECGAVIAAPHGA